MEGGEERGAEKQMDDYLKSIGLHRKKVAKDGSCLFRAVAEQVLHCQSLHTKVRARCVEFLKQNREVYEAFIEGDFEDYLFKLQDPQQWVGEVEINALAVMYKRDFLIFQEPGKAAVNITDNNFKDKVQLCFMNGNHYDSVYPISHVKNAALCQSILYELLYDGVFRVERGLLGPIQRISRPSDLLSDDTMAACGSSDESDPDASETLWVENGTTVTATKHTRGRGRGRSLPERVRRSLNPTLFRNIEYDVWHKTKRAQQKMDYCIAAGMQFTVGDRCQVRLEGGGRCYNATVKELPPNNGPVTVYIEELGKKQVPLWSLRPPNDENSWSTVVSRDKRLSNGHGEWEEKGKGRGRGKHTPASASVSSAAAPGSSGRVQKQHSWPMQATVDEQTGAKANSRKSVSSVEAAFGLTERQRSVKEEEEKTVALLEIQLRDEQSFPALGTQQSEGGRKKGAEKRRSQRNKTKSPVDDVRASSPSAGERPKSSTPPPADSAAAAPPATSATTSTNPTVPAVKPPAAPSADSSPAWLSSLKASTPSVNGAAAATSSPPAAPAAPSTKPSVTGGAVPPSVPSSATLLSFLAPVLPAASSPPDAPSSSPPPPSSSSSSLPRKSSTSPPPSSLLPPPTFIAPIAPSPTAAHGFNPTSSSHPRSSPPVPCLPHVPSPPPSSSSSLIHHAGHAHEAPAVQTPGVGGSKASLSQNPPQEPQNQSQMTQTQASSTQNEHHSQPSLPPNQVLVPEMQTEAQFCAPQQQSHIQPSALQTSLPQAQTPASHLQPQAQYLSQSEVAHFPLPAPDTSQASVPAQPQTSVTHPQLHVQQAQPPHPSQLPHPSLSLSASPTHPHLQNQPEALPPATQHVEPQPESPAHAPSQQSHPPPPPPPAHHHPHLPSAHPLPHPQSIPGAVPLQQLSQLYHDPLYPGFPQGEKGDVAPTPPYSSSRSGDDLPQDINVLRFFFNMGVKAYSMPMFAPYIYLLPLQQAHAMHPKIPSRSPSPHYPPSNPPTRHQETYLHSQYPPTSASIPPQYDHQAPHSEPTHPSIHQAGYPITEPPPHRMSSLPWQQHQIPPPRNPSFPVGYHTPSPPYAVSQALSQGYHPGQGPGHSLYPQSMPAYPPSSLGYQSSSAHEELQVSQGAMEQHQLASGDSIPGQGPGRVPGPAANLAGANNNRTMVVPGFAVKKEQGETLTRTVLLVDPPLNPNNPILVSNPGVNDVPVSMTTMKTTSTSGSPSPYEMPKTTGDSSSSRGYRGIPKLVNPPNTYMPADAGYLPNMAEPLSVACSTEDDWDEQPGFRQTTTSHRGQRPRTYRGGGGRGRGGHDPGRGAHRRRHGGEVGFGSGYLMYNSSHRGRGRERGY